VSRSVTIVTGFYPLAGHPRPTATYLELGRRLLRIPVRKVVWTSAEIGAELGREHRAAGFNAFPPSDDRFWIHDALRGLPYSVASQNPAKDTLGYHAIQHQKTQWLERTSRESESDILVWIDFGIFHLPDITEDLILDFVGSVRDDAIAIPGCRPRSDRIVLDHPSWRFCGAVLVCPRPLAPSLHGECVDALRGIVAFHRKVSWEVNTWAVAEMAGRLPIRQYHATTHDKRMLTAYDGPSS
jgi:hypothetical protein